MLERYAARAWLIVSAVLLALLAASIVFVMQHEQQDLADEGNAAKLELELLVSLAKGELQTGDYQHTQAILLDWGKTHPDVVSMRLLSGNDFPIADYRRGNGADNSLTLEAAIEYSYSGSARLVLVKDMQRIKAHRDSLILQISAILAVVAAMLLMLTQRQLRYRRQSSALQLEIAQREEADKQLRASESRFRDLTAMSSDFYWESDAEHRLTRRTENPREAAENVFAQASPLGKRRWEIPSTHPDAAGWQAHRAMLDAHLPFRNFEIARPRTNGNVHHVSVSGDPVFDAAGAFKGYRGAGTDITDRKQQEELIRRLLTENETMLNNALVGIVYLKQRHVVLCNRRLEEIFQYAAGELTDKSTECFYESREAFEQIGKVAYQAAAEGKNYTSDVRLRHKDGSLFWGTVTGRAVDPAHPHEGSIWIYSDITERKQAEEQLRIAATAFESQVGMIVTNTDSVILRVNRAFTEITGYTSGEALGQTPHLLKSGRHGPDFYRAMWESIHLTGGWQGEVWDKCKDGREFPAWLTISAVKDEHGAVSHYVSTHQDISERKQAEDKINELAFYDLLTGLPNRTLLRDRLKQAMAASARSGNHGALLFIDLDNFKTLNDTLGHDMGDQLLKLVAQRLMACVREGDTAARFGGDEFVVLLAGLSAEQEGAANNIEAVTEKILTALGQSYEIGDLPHRSTASIGVTLFGRSSDTPDELMKQADLAMYKAKEAGRNTVCFFDPALESAVKERAALEHSLRQAIAEKRFVLHYQAQVAGARLTGAEALVRWQHPQRGMVSPAEFIPLAEETGLILALGHWVLETACRQLAGWATHPEMDHLTLAVNVSANQFLQPDFVDQVSKVIAQSGANPQRLKLELTESLLVSNVGDVIEKMFALKAKGVGFSLDDFGTGYSSLSYLKRLPLDQLKIDQSFVRDILTDPNDAAIARTIVALAQSLGLSVIAEGVESEAQRDFLASFGCHAYQGYFFSRPLPLDDFKEFVRRS